MSSAVVLSVLVPVEALILDAAEWWTWQIVLWISAVSLFFFGGLTALWRQPHNAFGALMVVQGVTLWCAGLASSSIVGLAVLGSIASALPLAVVVHLVLAYPNGRLPGAACRIVVIGCYTASLLLQAPLYLFSVGSPLSLADRPDVVAVASRIQFFVGAGSLAAAILLSWRRWRGEQVERKRRLGPLAWYGLILLSALVVVILLAQLGVLSTLWLGVCELLVMIGLPVFFLLGLLNGAFGRAGELREFVSRVGVDQMQPGQLDNAVARALGEDSARVLYRGSSDHYVTADGAPAPAHAEVVRHEIVFRDQVVGAIETDAAAVLDDRLVRDVARVSGLPVDHQRVVAGLRATLLALATTTSALEHSRQRLIEAGDVERRRIARDLHDGVQQHILLLGLLAHDIGKDAVDPARVRIRADDLRREVSRLLDEIRDLVHGIMPAPLADRGLVAAVRWLGDRSAIPITVDASQLPGRLPPYLESTLYFVISELVTNAVKHSDADEILIRMHCRDAIVHVEVADDGCGGASAESGRGLLGVADRIGALGGKVVVRSRPGTGSGTTIAISVPASGI